MLVSLLSSLSPIPEMTHAEPDQGLHLQWRLNSQILVAKSDPICLVTLGQSNMAMGSPCKWRYVDIKMRKTPTHVELLFIFPSQDFLLSL